ncbi:MAG: hypothetical protein Ctma_0322 [Catillopecten margaritatus gill symbiont]|uniref:Uncharacterized protein n=1 Tax=Catillopecten margaritatus gill symbiont TaxID=3083288 RepID=A0AAU6PF59_9GAMM
MSTKFKQEVKDRRIHLNKQIRLKKIDSQIIKMKQLPITNLK